MAKKFSTNKDIHNFIPDGGYKELYVIEATFRSRHPDISKKPMSKPYYALHLFLKGSGKLITEHMEYELNKNTIFVRFPSEEITYYDYDEDPWNYIFITFQGIKAPSILNRLDITKKNRIIACDDQLKNLFINMITECRDFQSNSDIIANAYLQKILARMSIFRCKQATEKFSIQQTYITGGLEYINTNYGNSELDAEVLAKYLNLNTDYFLRIFKAKTGTPFSQFLISKRMSEAIALMNAGETSISTISDKVGYLSPAYFTSTFKKTFATSPSLYIKGLHNKTTS